MAMTLREYLTSRPPGEAVRMAAACQCDTSTIYRVASGDMPSGDLAKKIYGYVKGAVDFASMFGVSADKSRPRARSSSHKRRK